MIPIHVTQMLYANFCRNYSYVDSHGRTHEVIQDSRGRWIANEVLPGTLSVLPTLSQHRDNFQVLKGQSSQVMSTWLQRNLPSVRITGGGIERLHPDAAHALVSQLLELGHQYPEAFRFMESVQIVQPTVIGHPSAFGQWFSHSRVMMINEKWYQDGIGPKQDEVRPNVPNWFVPVVPERDGIAATVTHEFGHVMQQWLEDDRRSLIPVQAWIHPFNAREAINTFNTTIRPYGLEREDVSVYATSSGEERFAESFLAHQYGTEAIQQNQYMQAFSLFFRHIITSPRHEKTKGAESMDAYSDAVKRWLQGENS